MREDHIDQWDKILVWVTVSSRDGEPFTVTGKYLVESRPSLVCCMCSGKQAGTVPAATRGSCRRGSCVETPAGNFPGLEIDAS